MRDRMTFGDYLNYGKFVVVVVVAVIVIVDIGMNCGSLIGYPGDCQVL